jgi:sodium-dependent dicarboxylate transporter 2/3/5
VNDQSSTAVRVAGLAAGVAVALVIGLAPLPPGLSPAAQRTAALFALALVFWATEALPVAVTALVTVALQPLVGVRDARAAFASFASPVFFFVIAAFFLASALVASGVHHRFALWLLARAGTDPRRVLLALMAGTAALSTILSDVPTCAIFMAVALGIFSRGGIAPGSRFAKAVMIGIPMASLIGGVATPAGSSVNVLGIYLIEEYGKVRVPFLAWTALGLPLVVVLVAIAWWVLLRFFPPELAAVGSVAKLEEARERLGPVSPAERKVLALFAALIVLWVLSTWVKALDIVIVALVGAVVLFLPGVRLLSWPQAQREVGWDVLVVIGSVTSLGAASVDSGLARFLVQAVFGAIAGWPTAAAVAAVSALTVVAHLPIPIASVINSVLIPPVVLAGAGGGHGPAFYAVPVAFTASCAFLLPLDAVSLLTYAKGYYRMVDMLAPGVVVSAAWVVVITLLMMALGGALGF